jgi:alanyl-tRNA synthetase
VILPNQSTKKLVLTAQLSKNGGNYRSDLSAPTWIAEIGEGLAGRAGGKANFAQGSYQLPEGLSARDYEELLVNLQQRAERSSA